MYLALTYDHRLLDGREAVTFLVKVRRSTLHPLHAILILTPYAGQGVHRGPPPHAPRLNDPTLGSPLVDLFPSSLELPLPPSVDYSISKYIRHVTDQARGCVEG